MTAAKIQPKLLSKMSYKTVCGKLNRRDIPVGGELHVMRIIGQANGTGSGNSDYGAYTFFKGNFKATNVATGEEFRSGKLFLPAVAQMLLEGAFSDTVKSVDFAFDIFIVEADNNIGYEYGARPLVDAGESDPIAILEKQLAAGAPALPAPKTAQQPALTGTEEKPADEGASKSTGKKK